MGTYGLQNVIEAWEREQLTAEQVIGQILLLLQELEDRIGVLERRRKKGLEQGRSRHQGMKK